MALAITSHTEGENGIVLALHGEVDYATAPDLRDAIGTATGQGPSHIVLDLSGVDFMDSTGIGTLAVAGRVCVQAGIDLALRNPSPFLLTLFRRAANRRPVATVS